MEKNTFGSTLARVADEASPLSRDSGCRAYINTTSIDRGRSIESFGS
jgi:hypothetical protein